VAQIWPGIFIVTHKQWHGSVSFLYSHFTCRFSSMHFTVSSYCKMVFTDVNNKVGHHCLIKFCMEDGSKPSVIHGRLREYNMNIIQCKNQSAQVICCIHWSAVTQTAISLMVCDTVNNVPQYVWVSHIPHDLCHNQQSPSWPVPELTIYLMVCNRVNNLPQGLLTVNNTPHFLWHNQQPSWSVTVSLPHGLCHSQQSPSWSMTQSTPHGLCHSPQSPSWSVTQSVISLIVTVNNHRHFDTASHLPHDLYQSQQSLSRSAMVTNLPHCLWHSQQSPSSSVSQQSPTLKTTIISHTV
jgi:hypothetical protein